MASVTFDHATCIYPGAAKPSVDNLCLDIHDGEFLVLVGPSGCGKSTTLRMLAGLEFVDSGSILIGDKDVTMMDPKDRDIAMVFQNYALYPHMTVADNMGFALKLAKVDKKEIRRRVEEAAELLDLTDYLDRKPKALSGGQRQRVAMGRAIVRSPRVFLMDEPLSNLDARLRVRTRAQIAELQRRLGTTTVYVTHDQVEAMTMGDRVAVLCAGKLQQVDTPRNLFDHPANAFVAGFIGSPPMNFLPATVTGDRLHLPFGEVEIHGPKADAIRQRQTVIAGIRPEYFKDAELGEEIDNGMEFRAVVDQTEWLGNDLYAYIPYEMDPSVQRTLDELDKELDGEGVRPQLVVNLDSRSLVSEGEEAHLVFDPSLMHVFDPETGECLTRDEDRAAQIARRSEDERRRALERAKARDAREQVRESA